jgi:3-oxoacyl-[acyl-carrier protein] reductase
MNLKNAVVLITGGSSGIGRATAQALSEAGARVAITGRDPERLAEAARSLGVLGIRADVSKEADVLRTFQEVREKLGELDVLINNAGVGVLKELTDLDTASFEAVFATNVTGAMMMGREAAKIFRARKKGNMINIASTAALRGAPKGTAYYGSKFALRGMTECWRAELRKHNVRVFLINPSEVITDFARVAGFPQADHPSKLQGEDIAHAIKGVLEMNDRGFTPELTVFATNPVD